MRPALTILIPVRDEEENVKIISNEIINKIDCEDFEILFVNDYSNDKTEEVIKLMIENDKRIKYYNNNYVCIMMSDSSDTVEDLNKYYKTIKSSGCDAVFGSRFIKGGKTVNYPKIKYILNRFGNLLAKFLMWSDLNDFTNGFKIYKKETLLELFPIVSESFNIFFELPLKVISRNYNYKIIPIEYYNRTVGEAKFRIDELGSKYLFTLLYCFLEKILLNTKKK